MIQDLISLRDKVALVTGAASGIGRASAVLLASAGARVMVSDIAVEAGQETAELIRSAGGDAAFYPADVSDGTAVDGLIAATMAHFGRLDCAHNNAGIEARPQITAAIAEADWDHNLSVNLRGIWLCLRAELGHMEKAGGTIVNTASIGGLVAVPYNTPYAAAKAGVINMSRTVAIEYADKGIRCNAICPGYTRTAMIERAEAAIPGFAANAMPPLGRIAEASEMAAVVLFLLSPMSSYITGQTIIADGGALAKG